MAKNLLNAMRGKRFEGGSTITQQVAKNVLLGNKATLGRKLKEAILARRLEQTLDKEQILGLYLNEIWLGYRSYGVGAAAYNYFGKSLNDLNLAEMAYLAALPKGPDNYHPIRNKGAAIGRRNWIIRQMEQLGWVSRAEAAEAIKTDLKVQLAPARARYRDADYFVEEVREQALSSMGPRLNEGGYYMRTTLDPKMQTIARIALMHGLEVYDRRHGWRGAWGHVDIMEGWEKQASTISSPAERREWRAAVVDSVEGGVHVRVAKGGSGMLAAEDVTWAKAGKGLQRGDLVFVEPSPKGGYNLRQVPAVNGALVVVEPHSGRVLAMVGGYSFSLSKFNRATQAMRQPGSSFKPFVYATALENGFTPASVVLDAPISLRGATPDDTWTPKNYEGGFYGALPLRRGLELSRNTMTVRLAQAVGMSKISAEAVKLGVVDHMEPVLAMALGAGETTPYRLTGAYSVFLNGGRVVQPHLIEEVEDREGRTIYRSDRRDCPGCNGPYDGEDPPSLQPQGKPALDPVTAYQMTSMLQGVVQRGTAVAALSIGRPIGGKTGTTNEFRSAWFVGFTPQMIAGVFVGFDDNRSLGEHETGAVAALPIFIEFMQNALKDKPVTDFKPPKEAKFLVVNGMREAFRNGTEPRAAAATATAAGPSPMAPSGPTARSPARRAQARPSPRRRPPPARRPTCPACIDPGPALSGAPRTHTESEP